MLFSSYTTESVKSANTLLLIIKGTDMRLDASLQQMLREMEALFGEDMWNHVASGPLMRKMWKIETSKKDM